MNTENKAVTGEGNAPRVYDGQRITIKGKRYEVYDSSSKWAQERGDDFSAQPVNAKTNKPWQALRSFKFSEIETCDDKYCEVHNS